MFGGWYITVNKGPSLTGLLVGPVATIDELKGVFPRAVDECRARWLGTDPATSHDVIFIKTFNYRPGALNSEFWLNYVTTDQP